MINLYEELKLTHSSEGSVVVIMGLTFGWGVIRNYITFNKKGEYSPEASGSNKNRTGYNFEVYGECIGSLKSLQYI